jgi:hypothetical protein
MYRRMPRSYELLNSFRYVHFMLTEKRSGKSIEAIMNHLIFWRRSLVNRVYDVTLSSTNVLNKIIFSRHRFKLK